MRGCSPGCDVLLRPTVLFSPPRQPPGSGGVRVGCPHPLALCWPQLSGSSLAVADFPAPPTRPGHATATDAVPETGGCHPSCFVSISTPPLPAWAVWVPKHKPVSRGSSQLVGSKPLAVPQEVENLVLRHPHCSLDLVAIFSRETVTPVVHGGGRRLGRRAHLRITLGMTLPILGRFQVPLSL